MTCLSSNLDEIEEEGTFLAPKIFQVQTHQDQIMLMQYEGYQCLVEFVVLILRQIISILTKTTFFQSVAPYDDLLLMEYEGYQCLGELLTAANRISESIPFGFGLFPDENPCRDSINQQKATAHEDSIYSEELEEMIMPYRAFNLMFECAHTTYLFVQNRLVGDLRSISTLQKSSSTGSLGGMMKRSPSGAELNAALGIGIQSALGLDDPGRKVHLRGLF